MHDKKSKLLAFATVNCPMMYIGIPPLEDDKAIKSDLCIRNDALFLRVKFTSITTFANVVWYTSN